MNQIRRHPHPIDTGKQESNPHGHRIIALSATIAHQNKGKIPSDVLGSYTGVTTENEQPEQDADDL